MVSTAILHPLPPAFQKKRDIRDAMAEALANYLKTVTFTLPSSSTPRTIADVYFTWATFQERAKSAGGVMPIAAVLPENGKDLDPAFAPYSLDETWEGNVFDAKGNAITDSTGQFVTSGKGGYVLFCYAEYECTMTVLLRGRNVKERESIVAAFEDAFVNLESDEQRHGILLPMPSYYNRIARFQLQEQEPVGSESDAESNKWIEYLRILADAKKCKPVFKPAMQTRVATVVNGAPA